VNYPTPSLRYGVGLMVPPPNPHHQLTYRAFCLVGERSTERSRRSPAEPLPPALVSCLHQ